MLVKVLVEVALPAIYPQRLSNFARRRSCWWRWRRSVHARLRVICTPTTFRIFPGETDRKFGMSSSETLLHVSLKRFSVLPWPSYGWLYGATGKVFLVCWPPHLLKLQVWLVAKNGVLCYPAVHGSPGYISNGRRSPAIGFPRLMTLLFPEGSPPVQA